MIFRPFPNGNHGLCPQFYNFAFTNVFEAVPKIKACNQGLTQRDAKIWSPHGLRMGYFQTLDPEYDTNEKTLYCITTRDAPFNSEIPTDKTNKV